MADAGKHTGSCQCGNLKYEVPHDTKAAGKCHCQLCQKATGSSGLTVAVYLTSDVKMTGPMSHYTYTSDAGNAVTTTFCPNCGSLISYSNPAAFPGVTLIAAGTLDDSSSIVPQFVAFSGGRPGWDGDNPNIPHFAKMPG